MTEAEIQEEFWADRYFAIIKKGRIPCIDEFDTDFVDEALERWEEEDGELEQIQKLKEKPDEWVEVE